MTDQKLWVIVVAWYSGIDDVEVIGPFEQEERAKEWMSMHEVTEPHVVVLLSDPVLSSTVWTKKE